MTASASEVEAGQAVYTQRTLAAYDVVVLGVSNRFIWKCPTRELLAHYDAHVTANHLDVGVGTGYFVDRCRFPTTTPRLALMDLNETALDYAAQRAGRYAPETFRRNVLEPISFDGEAFDSIGLNYLLHCLPGTMASKTVVFDHLRPLMRPGAVIFGSTLLQSGVERGWSARRLMGFYNSKGIFSNRDDGLDDLEGALQERFSDVTVRLEGCAALFAARAP